MSLNTSTDQAFVEKCGDGIRKNGIREDGSEDVSKDVSGQDNLEDVSAKTFLIIGKCFAGTVKEGTKTTCISNKASCARDGVSRTYAEVVKNSDPEISDKKVRWNLK